MDPAHRRSAAGPPMAPVRMPLSGSGLWSRLAHGEAHESGQILRAQSTSPRRRERQVWGCAAAARPGMRPWARRGTHAQFPCTRHETTEMITLSRGSGRDGEAPAQTATNVAAPPLTSAATSAAPRAGSGGPAGGAGAPASPSSRPPKYAITARAAALGRTVPLTWNLTQATDWALTQTTDWNRKQTTGRNLRQAQELTPS